MIYPGKTRGLAAAGPKPTGVGATTGPWEPFAGVVSLGVSWCRVGLGVFGAAAFEVISWGPGVGRGGWLPPTTHAAFGGYSGSRTLDHGSTLAYSEE